MERSKSVIMSPSPSEASSLISKIFGHIPSYISKDISELTSSSLPETLKRPTFAVIQNGDQFTSN